MNLSQSFDGPDQGSSTGRREAPLAAGRSPATTTQHLLTDVSYEVESMGHRIDTPVFHIRARNGDGGLRDVEVEGYRPHFGVTQANFIANAFDICMDRRVLGAEVDCSPHLWADELELDNADELDPEQVAGWLSDNAGGDVFHEPNARTTLHDDPVAEVYTRVPNDVGGQDGIRNDLDFETYEADIPFSRRFLIDTEIYNGFEVEDGPDRVRYENWQGETDGPLQQDLSPSDPPDVDARMVVYDIEVEVGDDGFPSVEHAPQPITSISAYDTYEQEYKLFGLANDAWTEDVDDLESDIESETTNRFGVEPDVEIFHNETQMVEAFHQWVLSCNPDIFTGYNADGFDTPYLIQRSYNIQALSIKQYTKNGSPGTWIEEYNDERQVNFAMGGIVTLDILDAYRKTQFRALDSYKLEDVATAELGFGKTGLKGDELDEAWRDNPVEFFVYSVRDAQATVGVERESGLMDLFENLRRVTGAPYETAVSNGPMLDTLFLRRAWEKGLILPSNTEPDETAFHGAKVFDTVAGKHRNAVYPDLSSLYPSLFSMLNLGEETIVGDRDDLKASQYTESDCYKFPVDEREFAIVPTGESYDHIDRSEYKGVKSNDGSLREMFEAQYDWFYVLKPEVSESFIQETIDDLIELKYEYTGDLYSAVKRVTNSCFTPDTDVVTANGIKKITDIQEGEKVLSLNPETRDVELKPVTELIERPEYSGDLVNIKTGDIDLSVTPDHDILAKTPTTDENGYFVREAQDLADGGQYELPHGWNPRDGEEISRIDIKDYIDTSGYVKNGDRLEREQSDKSYKTVFDADDFIKFIGWYVTEGTTSVLESDSNVNYRVTITQKEGGDHYDEVVELLDSMGLDWYQQDDRHHSFYNKPLGKFLIENCGRLCGDKYLPSFIWNTSAKQKKLIFETMCKGDGDKSRDRYNTTSESLRDDFIRLCAELGHNPRCRSITHENENHNTKYVINYHDSKNSFVPQRTENTTAENGVYCAQVKDNHTLLAGRNRNFQWVPNCYGVMGDSASGGLGFRLYNRRVAEGITLAGRLTITHTADEFTGYINDNYDETAQLVGGDTDSSVTSIPGAPTLEHVWDWSMEAIEYVDNSYDQFVQETFGFAPDDDHRLAVELESVASALFFTQDSVEHNYRVGEDGFLISETHTDAVKKRYAQNIVWDDDDGWVDTEDPDEGYEEALTDPEDRSKVKTEETVSYDTFNGGVLDGMDPASHIDITGFEYVRSDSAQVTRDSQLQILTDILLSDTPEDRIESYLQQLVEDIESGDVPLADMGRPKGIGNPLDEYGWKDVDELDDEDITEEIEANEGYYRQTSGPWARGAKYATDWLPWEDLGAGSKPMKIPIDKVRGDEYPHAYTYHSFPRDDRPDPIEIDNPVDAIAVDNPERLPDDFVVDTDAIIEKELEGKLEGILETMGMEWDDTLAETEQVGLGAFG